MLGVRVRLIVAAAFFALPLTHAQARDCDRYPALCEPSPEAKAAAEAPRATVRKAKRSEKARAAAVENRSASRVQPARVSASAPAASVSRATTTLDTAVLLPRALSQARPAPPPSDSPALSAAGAWISLPTDDPRTGAGIELAPAAVENGAVAIDPVRFVSAEQVNEIDIADIGPDAGASAWLRYLLATFGAAAAAAASLRFFAV